MDKVKPKKHLGQHFLKDKNIAAKIVAQLESTPKNVLEIGAGTGVLTQFLLQEKQYNLHIIEIDKESVAYLKEHLEVQETTLTEGDFLEMNLDPLFEGKEFSIIGNFPYNISSQIFFKTLENRHLIPEVVCMIQKEVAERIAAPHGNKVYGILSVLMQAFYDVKYCFTVHENVFNPPPKVKSAVIRFQRKENTDLGCDERLFFKVVKLGFNQRRKTLRNSLKMLNLPTEAISEPIFDKRPEQLSVQDFVGLTLYIQSFLNKK